MIEQPEAPTRPIISENRIQHFDEVQTNTSQTIHSSSAPPTSEHAELLREVKQLRQDVQFLRQLLEHVQQQLR